MGVRGIRVNDIRAGIVQPRCGRRQAVGARKPPIAADGLPGNCEEQTLRLQ